MRVNFLAGALVLCASALTLFTFKDSFASPGLPTKDIECKNLRLKHRPVFSSYKITNNSIIVQGGLAGGKYPTNGIEIPIMNYKVQIRSDYQDIVITATRNIVGTGPFIISRATCPKFLPDGIELFLP